MPLMPTTISPRPILPYPRLHSFHPFHYIEAGPRYHMISSVNISVEILKRQQLVFKQTSNIIITPKNRSVLLLSRVRLYNPMNRSTPGLTVHHQLPEFTQTHVHRVGDAIQPSHPLLSPSPPAPNPSQHQSLFQ